MHFRAWIELWRTSFTKSLLSSDLMIFCSFPLTSFAQCVQIRAVFDLHIDPLLVLDAPRPASLARLYDQERELSQMDG